jgi:hypothetical protein
VIRWQRAHWRIVTVVPRDDVGRPNGRQRCPAIWHRSEGKRSRIICIPLNHRHGEIDGEGDADDAPGTHRLSSTHHQDDENDNQDQDHGLHLAHEGGITPPVLPTLTPRST